MKIALVTPAGVDRSGTHRVVPSLLWLIARLAREHDVHVFALHQERAPASWRLRGATVHNIGYGRTRPRAVAALLGEHRRGALDILHAFRAVPCGVIAGATGRLLRRPVVLHLAGGELVALPDIAYGGRLTRGGRAWLRLALRAATRVTAASGPMREAAARLGCDALRLPLGVALDEWPPLEPRARDPRRPARLLHVASLNRVKDQDTLLRAAARLAREGVDFTLDIAGVDTLGGDARQAATALGLAGRVNFHGFLPHAELRPLFERADLLLVSSRHEAGPAVALEAAVAGVPTVGTAVGHLADWAPAAAAAVPVGDDEALAREAAALLDDEARRLSVARAAQARALAEDAAWTANQVAALHDALVR